MPLPSTDLRDAIRLALDGRWDAAHGIVQKHDDRMACWIHAVLHRIEGDADNARYWYRRAGREWSDEDPQAELRRIRDLDSPSQPRIVSSA